MNMKNKLAALTILTAFGFSNVNAASIDEELAVIAAEQAKDNPQEVNPPQTFNPVPEKKSRKELKAEEKRLREERKAEEKRRKEEKKAEEKRRKEEMKAAEKEVREAQKKSKDKDYKQLKNSERTSPKENFPKIDPVNTPVESVPVETAPPEKKDDVVTFDPTQTSTTPPQTSTTPPQTSTTPPQTSTTPPLQTSTTPPPTSTTPPTTSTTPIIPPATLTPPEQNLPTVTNLPNPIVMQANFEELTSVVHFVPLYIPKKSGFSINSMMSIDNRIAEIRYGRRWEPEVSLRIRTYKRMDGEETKDISGVSGVKWRVDMTSGTTVYIAKIAENRHVAAWAVGKYTFSAYVENLSFAAFHAIVADELVDLSRHYYID